MMFHRLTVHKLRGVIHICTYCEMTQKLNQLTLITRVFLKFYGPAQNHRQKVISRGDLRLCGGALRSCRGALTFKLDKNSTSL